MSNIDDQDVIVAMKKYGGGFVSALGEAARRADVVNLRRIKQTWPEVWAEYVQLARSDKVMQGRDR